MEFLYPTNRAWVGDLVRWMEALGFSEPAVRAAVSRSTSRGWLIPEREGRRAYYRLSPRVAWQVKQVRERLYPQNDAPWDGRWRILIYAVPEDKRSQRDKFRNELVLLGFGTPAPGVWINPNAKLDAARDLVRFYRLTPYVELFEAERLTEAAPLELIRKSYHLEEIQERYRAFLEMPEPAFDALSPREAFAQLVRLVHEARKFLFLDPGLPPALTPPGFLGPKALERFLCWRAALYRRAAPLLDAATPVGSR